MSSHFMKPVLCSEQNQIKMLQENKMDINAKASAVYYQTQLSNE